MASAACGPRAISVAAAAPATLAPFLYPSLFRRRVCAVTCSFSLNHLSQRWSSTDSGTATLNNLPASRLNPAPDDYAAPSFADKADLTLYAGRGGNGCISFLREAYLPDGPPNGGDGGTGGNIYIQAAPGETSLHKIARRRFVRAGRGRHGQGSAKSGTRGDDVVITVPVGTIVRELERQDPAAEEEMNLKAWKAMQKQLKREQRELEAKSQQEKEENDADDADDADIEEWEEDLSRRSHQRIAQHAAQEEEGEDPGAEDPQRQKWLLYPGMSKTDMRSTEFPRLPRRTRLLQQPPSPVYLDLSRPTPNPILLAVGGIGGLGNSHFTSRDHPRPIFATKGDEAVTMKISLELKLLADVGLVGLPNAGKSTLLRALTNSRTRVGNWAFTTLHPNIGTVVLDKYSGRPSIPTRRAAPIADPMDPEDQPADPRTRFTVADIPGLIEGAHLDKGLGIAFLRHVERARVLAFVIDLSAGDAVKALKALWREVGLYAHMREEEEQAREIDSRVDWDLTSDPTRGPVNLMNGPDFGKETASKVSPTMHIAGKPWFVVATKADLPETRENFKQLKAHLDAVSAGQEEHPSGVEGAWQGKCAAIPVSAINGQGMERIVHWTTGLLE